jgi:hypothetical protein
MGGPKAAGARKVAEGPKAAEAGERKYGGSMRLDLLRLREAAAFFARGVIGGR